MALRELNIKIGANAQALDKELTRIGRRLAAFSKQMQQIGSDLTQSLSLPLAGVSAGALTAFAGMERLEKGLTAVMGSSEAAAVELEKLKKSAQLPGLGFEEAVKGSIRLQAVGFSADEARKTLGNFRNGNCCDGRQCAEPGFCSVPAHANDQQKPNLATGFRDYYRKTCLCLARQLEGGIWNH
jgi:hypothetical protein